MNFSDMQIRFDAYVSEADVDTGDLIEWFNEAQLDLALDFAPSADWLLENVKAGVGNPVPDDCVRILDADDTYYINAAGMIVFPSGGTHEVVYRQMPAKVTTENYGEWTSGLPSATHYLMCIWAAYRYWLRESEGDGEEMAIALRWLQDYYAAKNTLKTKLDNGNNIRVDRWTIE